MKPPVPFAEEDNRAIIAQWRARWEAMKRRPEQRLQYKDWRSAYEADKRRRYHNR